MCFDVVAACHQRPVVVFSPEDLRVPLHEALLKLSASFSPYQTDHLFRSEIDEVGLEMVDHLLAVASKRTQHLLLTVREEDIKHLHAAGIYPIVLLLQCAPPHRHTPAQTQQKEQLQKVFYRHEYEVISVDQTETADMDSLARRLEKQVQMMQTDVIWVRCSKVTAPF
ncbi:hypothetical protein NP493_1003g00010 [Ridgeia piscesae]|uniref:Uncharacterized protein n=1 Tax=Ridgeia piscesae TaxID=27915 RepID=A0AAD9KIP0_RIDPI|nr:hypothetical protein NP493_1003g00010 [Ridgeia piscesae]